MVRVLVLALLALVGALFPSFSPAANLYVLVVGGTLAWLGLSGRLTRRALAGPLPAPTRAPLPVGPPAPAEAPVPAEAPRPLEAPRPEPVGEPQPGPLTGVFAEALAEPAAASAPAGTAVAGGSAIGPGAGAAAREASSRLSPAAAWWLVPVLLLGVVEVTDLALGSTHPHPTLSVLLDPVLDRYPARAAAYFGWLAAFWWLVRR